jgi:ribosomal protein L17
MIDDLKIVQNKCLGTLQQLAKIIMLGLGKNQTVEQAEEIIEDAEFLCRLARKVIEQKKGKVMKPINDETSIQKFLDDHCQRYHSENSSDKSVFDFSLYQVSAPVLCADGYMVSIQGIYPGMHADENSYELGFPNKIDHELDEYREYDIYNYVPKNVVVKLLMKHGGITKATTWEEQRSK